MKKLDDIDLRILTLLYQDADITNKELAAKIGIAPSTCLERVKRMKSSGVIKNAFIDINFNSIGGNIEAIAAIKLQPYSEKIVNQLRDDLLKLPEIISLYHMGGSYDYFIHMSVKDSEHLRQFVEEYHGFVPSIFPKAIFRKAGALCSGKRISFWTPKDAYNAGVKAGQAAHLTASDNDARANKKSVRGKIKVKGNDETKKRNSS